MSAPLLEVMDLRVAFESDGAVLEAVRGLSFTLEAASTLALVGESGCGKSTIALAIARLLPHDARLSAGRLALAGMDILELSEPELCGLRGREIGLVFQDPLAALDPVMRVGAQVAEGPRLARGLDARSAEALALELLSRVGLDDPAGISARFAHQLSGGERQRVGLAIALSGGPRLLVADEPTSALDVTVQAGILALLRELVAGRGLGLLLITHDLGVVAELADEVAVIYAGRIVESAATDALLARPRHPYTAALLRARPERAARGAPLQPIPGAVPSLSERPSGCAFRTRCPLARARCAESEPELTWSAGSGPAHAAACFFADELVWP